MQPSEQEDCERNQRSTVGHEPGSRRLWWQLRVWYGMTARAWFSLLWRNRFAVAPSRLGICAVASCFSLMNSGLAWIQWAFLSRRIDRVALRDDPIFVLGHWRSGTTLLHELLALDPDHHSPSTYACLAPEHFLVSEKMLGPLLRFLLPRTRSQDDVAVGLNQPQEDEWAICTLGLPTPYQAIAFSRRLNQAQQYFDLESLQPQLGERWVTRWMRFLKAVAWQMPGKRLILKSPLHTARIPLLLAKFPKARFIHLKRNPQDVCASTMRLWRRLAEDEGLQGVDSDAIEAFVLENYQQLFQNYVAHASAIPHDRLYELRYEELVSDPVAAVRKLYEYWQLDFVGVSPLLADYVSKIANFRTASYPPSLRAPCVDSQFGGASDERFDRVERVA
jgi:omega-hydroxy-beta-dihydromenaquinone-9 sulfotransferase